MNIRVLAPIVLLAAIASACGVKGPPLPPHKAIELREGRLDLVQDKKNDELKKDNKKND